MKRQKSSSPAYTTLVYRYHEQIYRLALLVGGDNAATALTALAFADLQPNAPDPQFQLILGLLPHRKQRKAWRRQIEQADLQRANLGSGRADALLRTLAALMPEERLLVGMHYLLGTALDELPTFSSAQSAPAALLPSFRIAVAREMGLVPAKTPETLLLDLDRLIGGDLHNEAAVAVRRLLIEQPELRSMRDALSELRELLSRAIPALFAAPPPQELTEQLLADEEYDEPQQQGGLTRARLGITAAVLAIVLAIVFFPALLGRREQAPAAAVPQALELIDAAIHRFDRPKLEQGVLHETFRVHFEHQPIYQVERWYDYAPLHRIRVELRQEASDSLLMSMGTDGRSQVQFRFAPFGLPRPGIDARISESDARSLIPLLRGEPLLESMLRFQDAPNPGGYYLAEARTAQLIFLGGSRFLDRPAYLVAYDTQRQTAKNKLMEVHQLRVVLTIDAQTYSLLDIALFPKGTAESVAFHPFQVTTIELLEDVPDQQFTLPADRQAVARDGLPSVSWPDLPIDTLLSLKDARQTAADLLVPRELPDPAMRAIAVATLDQDSSRAQRDGRIVLLYEGEFQSLMVFPDTHFFGSIRERGEERNAGKFRYRVISPLWSRGIGPASVFAIVSPQDAPQLQRIIVLNAPYIAEDEREQLLGRVIASLTLLTEQNLDELQVNFYVAQQSDGEG